MSAPNAILIARNVPCTLSGPSQLLRLVFACLDAGCSDPNDAVPEDAGEYFHRAGRCALAYDEMVKKARARLFGSWELNWMAYNCAHDVALPGSKRQFQVRD